MNIQLHKNARTTPAIRLELQSQPESVSDRELAEAYHLNRHTVAKWRQHEGVEDASHRPQQPFLPVSSRFALIRVHLQQKRRLFMDSRLVRIFCANLPSQQARGASYNLLLSFRKGYLFRHRSWCYRLSSSSTSPESIKS